MNDVRIGIAGIGGMGSNHAQYLSRGEVPGAQLTRSDQLLKFPRPSPGTLVEHEAEHLATFDGGLVHLLYLTGVDTSRLLRHDMQSRLKGGDGNRRMEVVRCSDDHRIHLP